MPHAHIEVFLLFVHLSTAFLGHRKWRFFKNSFKSELSEIQLMHLYTDKEKEDFVTLYNQTLLSISKVLVDT